MTAISRLIQAARDRDPSLTALELAKRTGLSRQQVYSYSNPGYQMKDLPKYASMVALAEALRVRPGTVIRAFLESMDADLTVDGDALDPEREVLIATLNRLGDTDRRRVSAIVQTFLDDAG